ncbi:MAG: prepilin-type N-terminal cleavage/methylation domain-containing protein [Elusimicrobiaceae bacterium]|nr:prepilin-type N-terminal cleavage/methylation domain-containing protein [Elusimicrobiaceae bacterium]
MKKGFTLIEVLVVVIIVTVLTTVAVPKYMRSIERSRAVEAMTNIKALNEAVYAYSVESGGSQCPVSFKKIAVMVNGTLNNNNTVITTRNFTYTLNAATNALIPGTDCAGVTAKRNGGAKYDYVIWNPYLVNGSTLGCTSTVQASIDICNSLQLDTTASPY